MSVSISRKSGTTFRYFIVPPPTGAAQNPPSERRRRSGPDRLLTFRHANTCSLVGNPGFKEL